MSRRWFQFRLRTLFIVVTLCAVAMSSWVAYIRPRIQSAQRQREAVAPLLARGAKIEWRPSGPAWLQYLVGEERLREVVAIDLSAAGVCDADLAVLAELPTVERLNLSNTSIGDKGLRHVRHLKQLRHLALGRTKITDDGLVALSELTHLQTLDVHITRVSEAGLSHLTKLTDLQELSHSITASDFGIERLALLPRLKLNHLYCEGLTATSFERLRRIRVAYLLVNDSTDGRACTEYLADHPTLTELGLQRVTLGDADLTKLVATNRLVELSLSAVPITDASLPALAKANRLRHLTLYETQVTLPEVTRQLAGETERIVLEPRVVHFGGGKDGCSIKWGGPCVDPSVLRHCRSATSLRLAYQCPRDLDWITDLSALRDVSAQTLNDAALLRLVGLPNLTSLDIDGGKYISAAALRSLRSAASLRKLAVGELPLTDDHMAAIGSITQLRELKVRRKHCDGASLAHLAGLRNLEVLNVDDWENLNDAAMCHVAVLKGLRAFHADGTSVTDAGLKWLDELPSLEDVSLGYSRCSAKKLQELRATLDRRKNDQ